MLKSSFDSLINYHDNPLIQYLITTYIILESIKFKKQAFLPYI